MPTGWGFLQNQGGLGCCSGKMMISPVVNCEKQEYVAFEVLGSWPIAQELPASFFTP